MEYRVRVWSANQGPGVPLLYVAEAMAKRAATGYGTRRLHGPTLKNFRPEFVRLLSDAAMSGHLTVCDSKGRIASATELIETASASAAEVAGAASAASITAENALIYLFARQKHLIEWGETSGDVFLFVETPGTLVISDLRNFTEAGFGEVIKAGHFINAGGGGESEPWRDDLYDTAPCATKPAQSSAAMNASVVQAKETKEERQDRRLEACINAGLCFESYKGRLPDGVGDVAYREGVKRQSFSPDVKAALERRGNAKREGVTVHRT